MKRYTALTLLISAIVFCGCSHENLTPIENAMRSAHPGILNVAHNPQKYEVQILMTQIDRDSSNRVAFTDHSFRLNDSSYFYPASTVKLPMALLAAEFVSNNDANIELTTPYSTSRDSLTHSIGDDIRQIFAVSDNEAYNRLYELIGRDEANRRLRQLGIQPIRLAHRLSTPSAAVAERDSLQFQLDSTVVSISVRPDGPIETLEIKKQSKGKGFMRGEDRVNTPMDFSEKNYFPITAQHELMKRLFFPENFPAHQQFRISEDVKQQVLNSMHQVPRKQGYDETDYYDSYGKFFLYGDNKDQIPDNIKIYNKVGYAYGTLTETAYIVDTDRNIEFLLTATILVNKNGIFNDDTYEYDDIGIPFLAQLGREIYTYEYVRTK